MLEFLINASSVQESNIFLRKLWSELNQVSPMGWNMYPYRKDNRVTIGTSAVGEISFDYTRRGCIKRLYIDNTENAEAISRAVQHAKENPMKVYAVSLELKGDREISIEPASIDGCRVFTKDDRVYLQVNFEAYSVWDIERYLPHKYASVLSILYEYTHTAFDIARAQMAEGSLDTKNSEFPLYNYKWVDYDEIPQTEGNAIVLPQECLRLIAYVMDDRSNDETVDLLLNSSRLLMTTKRLVSEINFPYSSVKADIINSMACSSFEPLSLILDDSTERCPECGNLKYSITKKIKKMCTHYFDEDFAKYVSDVIYKNRSAFLHTGRAETTQRGNKGFCPQIDIDSGMIMMPSGMVRENIFAYSSFLFRNIAHDYYCGTLQ